jgi:hypothetical protein
MQIKWEILQTLSYRLMRRLETGDRQSFADDCWLKSIIWNPSSGIQNFERIEEIEPQRDKDTKV